MNRNSWKEQCLSVPLSCTPKIIEAGLATHGVARGTPPPERFYHHEGIWAIHGHTYSAVLNMSGHVFPVCPGYVSLVAPATTMDFQFEGRSSHFYVLFELPRDATNQTETIATMRDFGAKFGSYNDELGRVVTFSAMQPRRAEALLWSLLWELVETPVENDSPMVTRARREIEGHLGEELNVATLARNNGLSHNQFTRVFHAATGETPSQYIARRRLERVRQLLLHTTRPVKSIAAETGFGDIQALSKGLKRQYGNSPRAIRREGK